MPIHISHVPLAGEIAAIVIGVLVVVAFVVIAIRSRQRGPAAPMQDDASASRVERDAASPFGRPHF